MSHSVDEHYAAYTRTERKARKEHRCCACKETIERGHRYVYVTAVFEGTVDVYKRCVRCEHIFQLLVDKLAGRDEWPDEDLNCGHVWGEDHDGDPPPEVAALAFLSQSEAQSQIPKNPEVHPKGPTT